MIIKNGELIKYKDIIIRILYVDNVDKIAFAVNMNENKWPYLVSINKIEEDIEQENGVIIEDTFTYLILEEDLNEVEIKKRDFAWKIVSSILSKADGINIFVGKYRTPIVYQAVEEYNVSYNTIKNYLIRYYQHNQSRMALVPLFKNIGGRGKQKSISNKKRGRPCDTGGINIDDEVIKQFTTGLNKYYFNERKTSLKTTYELIIRDYYVKEYITEKDQRIPILKDKSEMPKYSQFLYWFKKLNSEKNEVVKRDGLRKYNQNNRAIIGSSTQEVNDLGSNSLWQIDSTICDIYLMNSDRTTLISRPVLYVIIDVYSRLIISAYVTLESFNSYSGAMMALLFGMSMKSKIEYFKKYGIDISEEEMPSAIPQNIVGDRGEILNNKIVSAISNLGIGIQQTPPYRADFKGIVERAFGNINHKFKPFADGIIVNGKNMIQRGSLDYRLKSNLTLEDFTKIVLKCMIFHNTSHVLSEDIIKEMEIDGNLPKIPINIYRYGIENKKGIVRTLPDEVIKINVLPVIEVLVTEKGVAMKKLFYVSEYTLRNSWHSKARTKGNYSIKVSYNPLDLSEIYYVEEDRKTFHVLKLVEHLQKFNNKSEYEIDNYFKQEKEINESAKDKELQSKVKLYNDIEDIVKEARVSSKENKDNTLSKRKRLKGITENNRIERELHREKYFKSEDKVDEEDNKESIVYQEDDELDIYSNINDETWGENNG